MNESGKRVDEPYFMVDSSPNRMVAFSVNFEEPASERAIM